MKKFSAILDSASRILFGMGLTSTIFTTGCSNTHSEKGKQGSKQAQTSNKSAKAERKSSDSNLQSVANQTKTSEQNSKKESEHSQLEASKPFLSPAVKPSKPNESLASKSSPVSPEAKVERDAETEPARSTVQSLPASEENLHPQEIPTPPDADSQMDEPASVVIFDNTVKFLVVDPTKVDVVDPTKVDSESFELPPKLSDEHSAMKPDVYQSEEVGFRVLMNGRKFFEKDFDNGSALKAFNEIIVRARTSDVYFVIVLDDPMPKDIRILESSWSLNIPIHEVAQRLGAISGLNFDPNLTVKWEKISLNSAKLFKSFDPTEDNELILQLHQEDAYSFEFIEWKLNAVVTGDNNPGWRDEKESSHYRYYSLGADPSDVPFIYGSSFTSPHYFFFKATENVTLTVKELDAFSDDFVAEFDVGSKLAEIKLEKYIRDPLYKAHLGKTPIDDGIDFKVEGNLKLKDEDDNLKLVLQFKGLQHLTYRAYERGPEVPHQPK